MIKIFHNFFKPNCLTNKKCAGKYEVIDVFKFKLFIRIWKCYLKCLITLEITNIMRSI